MVACPESPADEVAARVARNDTLKLGEVVGVHFVVLDKVCGDLVVFLVREGADHLHLELRLAVKQQLRGGDAVGLHELHDELHDVKLVEELKFDYNIRGFRKAPCIHVHFCQFTEVVGVYYFL